MAASPFKLLEAYGPDEMEAFFGRDAEIYALYNLLQQTRLVLLYGASGTGKTSLIQAGLPKVFHVTDWYRVSVRRRDNINQSLKTEVARALQGEDMATDIVQGIKQLYETRWIPVYLVFDQFEELFTLGKESKEREDFFETISLLLAENIPCKVIISMREEYIGHLYAYEHKVPLFDKRFRLEPMADDMATQVVENICRMNGIALEKERLKETGAPKPDGYKPTVEEIRDQVKEGKQPVYLPYLQIYLHQLYEYTMAANGGKKPVFESKGIHAVGKLGDVLQKFIDGKTDEAQRHFFLSFGASEDFAERLLDEFATSAGTKQARRVSELARALEAKEEDVEEALRYFSDEAKLLRADENDVERYEPVHDVVAKQIHELRSTEDKEYKDLIYRLDAAWQRWIEDHKTKERLLPEIDINLMGVYQKRLEKKEEFKEKWAVFLKESRAHLEAKKRYKRRISWLLTGTTIAALCALVVALVFWRQVKLSQIRLQHRVDAFETAEKRRKAAEQTIKEQNNANLRRKIDGFIIGEAWDLARDSLHVLEKENPNDPQIPILKSKIPQIKSQIK